MTQTTTSVRHAVTVPAPPESAFDVFTDGFGTWWPVQAFSTGEVPVVDVEIEPRAGGRWGERLADGSTTDWGRVLVHDRPGRVVLTWELDDDWQPDPDVRTEVEVTFAAAGDGTTRVELEHRGLDAYGDRAEEMRAALGSDEGWGGLLQAYAAKAAG